MSETPQPDAKPKLRWYQYSLASLFVLMTVAAIGCSWFACKMVEANKRKEAVETVEELRGAVWYDYEFDADDNRIGNAEPPGPAWFRNLVGVDFLANVVWVDLGDARVTDGGLMHLKRLTNLKLLYICNTQVSDAGLKHLQGLTNLRKLHLSRSQVTDAGLKHLRGMTKLEQLWLVGTQVSDAGLEHLKGLENLNELNLRNTQVTDAGAQKLQQALPTCDIHW